MNKENHKDALIITQDAMAKVRNERDALVRDLDELTSNIGRLQPGQLTMEYVELGGVQWAIKAADQKIELLDHILEALWSSLSVVHVDTEITGDAND